MVGGEAVGAAKGVATSTVSGQAMPFRRTILWTTLIFFIILAFVGIIESAEQKSPYPLLQRTVLKFTAADNDLGKLVMQASIGETPSFQGFMSKTFVSWLWYWVVFYFEIVSNLYFIFFGIFMCYLLFNFLDNTSAFKSVIFGLLLFTVLMSMTNTLVFVSDLHGKTLPATRTDSLKLWWVSTYPYNGLARFVEYYVTPQHLKDTANWIESSQIASIITNVKQGTVDITGNDTIVNQTT